MSWLHMKRSNIKIQPGRYRLAVGPFIPVGQENADVPRFVLCAEFSIEK